MWVSQISRKYILLAEGPGVARGKKMLKKRSKKKIGPAIWPAIGNIYIINENTRNQFQNFCLTCILLHS